MGKENLSIEEIQEALAQPFKPDEVEWRIMRSFTSQKGTFAWVAAYIESRAIMNRLDEVLGVGNWENEYRELHNGIICGIRIHLPNGKSVIKWDGADLTSIEQTKGGLSNAFKRSAVQFGIGRYLYKLQEQLVKIYPDTKQGKNYINDKKKQIVGSWDNPNLPSWALPQGSSSSQQGNQYPNQQQGKQQGNKQSQQLTNSQQKDKQRPNNQQKERNELLSFISRAEKQIGLKDPNYIVRIFNKATNNSIQNANYIKQNASIVELQKYCRVLKPVKDICLVSVTHNCPMDEMLRFAQIIKPTENIESIMSLFFIMNNDDVEKILGFAKQENERKQQQPA